MSVFSNASRSSRRSRRRHTRGPSNDSIPVRPREGGRLESITRRASADILSVEGTTEGTVMYGVGEEMLRLMFGGAPLPSEADAHGERERTRSLPRRVLTPKRAAMPRGGRVASPVEENDPEMAEESDPTIGILPDFGGSIDLGFSNPTTMIPASSTPAGVRRKGHRRGTASKENASFGSKNRKSRTRSKSAPLGLSDLQRSLEVKPAGILTNGHATPLGLHPNRNSRVVIVATTLNAMTPQKPRQTTRSNASDALAVGDLVAPGVVVTAPTPPAPRRSLSMPLEPMPMRDLGAADSPAVESSKGTVSRGTSVQFVPESYEGRRKSSRSRKEGSSVAVPEVTPNGKGKRKVEREPTDAPDSSVKKPRLSVEDMDITFMGEPIFEGRPSRRSGLGSVASSYHSVHSRHSQSYQRPPPPPLPSPTSSPDPERATIPMHAILTPRVQSLYGTAGPDYATRRQSISSVQRPKSRASARSVATGGAKSARSNVTGARSNRTGASVARPRNWRDRLPLQGWCFILGFFMPPVWWYAAFARAERGYYGGGLWSREVESQWEGASVRNSIHRDDGRIDAHTWRFRCRLMAAFSIVVYVPVIVLAAVFAR